LLDIRKERRKNMHHKGTQRRTKEGKAYPKKVTDTGIKKKNHNGTPGKTAARSIRKHEGENFLFLCAP
jgi:hypothetical protein